MEEYTKEEFVEALNSESDADISPRALELRFKIIVHICKMMWGLHPKVISIRVHAQG